MLKHAVAFYKASNISKKMFVVLNQPGKYSDKY